jgi:N-acetyl-gamma-glutamylphosphate reductase
MQLAVAEARLRTCKVIQNQFKAVTDHNSWAGHEQATHLLPIPQGQPANILHRVPAAVAYEDSHRVLKEYYEDHQLVAYQSKLKARAQVRGKSLQELAAAVKQPTGLLSSYLRTSSRGRHPTLLLREGRTGM